MVLQKYNISFSLFMNPIGKFVSLKIEVSECKNIPK